MHSSPLNLDHYVLTVLRLEETKRGPISPKASTDRVSIKDSEIRALIDIGEPKQPTEPPHFAIRLTIHVEPKSGNKKFPYRMEVGVQGFFTVLHSKGPTDARNLAAVNGTSMLYGVIRELVLSHTIRFAAGPVMLPSVHFLHLAEKPAPQASTPRPGLLSASEPILPLSGKRVRRRAKPG